MIRTPLNFCILCRHIKRNLKLLSQINVIPVQMKRSKMSNPSMLQVAMLDHSSMISFINKSIPPLDGGSHKGQAGRIGIIGGSLEYTGAPYFAGISALKVGADLVHIFCPSSAATVIKSYSPDLIVHPLLDQEKPVNEITKWFDRLHSIVIGPGLGRETGTFKVASELIQVIKEKKIPLVIDADGLFLISENPSLLKDFTSPVILTPNKVEFDRLYNKAGSLINEKGMHITVLKKGANDMLLCADDNVQWELDEGGSGRRCGGQGDLLSGSIATFLNWTLELAYETSNLDDRDKNIRASSLACFAGSVLVRKCNEKAFSLKGRSMLANDMIDHIHESFNEIFGE